MKMFLKSKVIFSLLVVVSRLGRTMYSSMTHDCVCGCTLSHTLTWTIASEIDLLFWGICRTILFKDEA